MDTPMDTGKDSVTPSAAAALSDEQKKDLTHRLARIEGQLRGVQKLLGQVDQVEDCLALAQQLSAARKALDRTFVHLLSHALVHHTEQTDDLAQIKANNQMLASLLEKFV